MDLKINMWSVGNSVQQQYKFCFFFYCAVLALGSLIFCQCPEGVKRGVECNYFVHILTAVGIFCHLAV